MENKNEPKIGDFRVEEYKGEFEVQRLGTESVIYQFNMFWTRYKDVKKWLMS